MGYTVTTRSTMSCFQNEEDAIKKFNRCQTAVLSKEGKVIQEKGDIHCKSLLTKAIRDAITNLKSGSTEEAKKILIQELALMGKQIVDE